MISIIAAIGQNHELGKNNKLLWQIPEDLKRFKKITQRHPVIMGRKTYQSLSKPLSDRTNIVVTRDLEFQTSGVLIADSLERAINKAKQAKGSEEIFLIGGGQIYDQGIKLADKLYLTLVKGNYEADTFFPDYSEFKKEIFREEKQYQNQTYVFIELTR